VEQGFLAVLAVLLISASVSPPALAAEPASTSLLEEGLRLQKEGREAEALERLRLARRVDPDSTEIAYQLGSLLGRAGYLWESRDLLAEAAGKAPGRAEIHLEHGRVLARMRAREAALDSLEKTLRLDPPDRLKYVARIAAGKVYADMGRLDRAAASFESVLEENPDSPAALAYLGMVMRRRGDFEAALEYWRRYLQLRPRNGWVANLTLEAEAAAAEIASARDRLSGPGKDDAADWILIAELLLDAGDIEGALGAISGALRAGAGSELLRFRAEILQLDERWSEADRDLRKYLKHHPDDRGALYRLALGRRRMADCRGEEKAWRQVDASAGGDPFPFRMLLEAVQCDGTDPSAHRTRLEQEATRLLEAIESGGEASGLRMRIALIREAQKRYQDSFEQLRLALRPDPHDNHNLQGFRRLATEHPDEAIRFAARLEERLRTASIDTLDLLMYGYIVWLNGDSRTALRLFQAGRRIDPDNPDLQIAHAHALSMLAGQPDQALETLRVAAAGEPANQSALQALGLLELERRRIKEAIATGKKLLAIDPDSYHALGLMGSAEAMAGRHEQAIGYLLAALRSDPTDPEGTVRFQLAVSLAGAGKVHEARWIIHSDLPWGPEEIYEKAWKLVREYYVDRDFSGQDWQAWRHRFDGRLASRDDAYRAIVEMLAALRDRYTRLRPPEETAVLFLNPRSEEVVLDDEGRPLPGSRSVVSEDLSEGIRYIRLTNLSDPTLVERMRESLKGAEGKSGVILDLRGNPGGVQGESEIVGSLFLEEGTALGEVVDRWGRRGVEAGGEEPMDPDVPLVVLVDENTGSAAESLAGALRESGRARILGTPTRGKGASQVSQLLPGGAMVMVTAARNVTPDGSEIEGIGIQPDVPMRRSGEKRDEGWIEKAKEILEEDSEPEETEK
jgi:C-terminal processing protease CtpA/Prc/cytochrome c-type biogenesis protein CcmH/NrfG